MIQYFYQSLLKKRNTGFKFIYMYVDDKYDCHQATTMYMYKNVTCYSCK